MCCQIGVVTSDALAPFGQAASLIALAAALVLQCEDETKGKRKRVTSSFSLPIPTHPC